jgi:nicotinamide mononucleotide transporter
MSFFDIQNIAFRWLGYDMSYIELVATVFGLLAVWLSAKEHIANWGFGLINITLAAFVFYQSSLYSDMFLQGYFFATGVYGWWQWSRIDETNKQHVVKISFLSRHQQVWTIIFILISTLLIGYFLEKGGLQRLLPTIFKEAAAFPYADTLIMMMSIVGNYLLTIKKIESWILWVVVDIIAPVLYFQKGLLLFTFEYLVFLALAAFALINWLKIYKNQKINSLHD